MVPNYISSIIRQRLHSVGKAKQPCDVAGILASKSSRVKLLPRWSQHRISFWANRTEQPSQGNFSESRLCCAQRIRRGSRSSSLLGALPWALSCLFRLSVLKYQEPLLTLQLPGQAEGITVTIFCSGGETRGYWVQKRGVKPGTFLVPAPSVVPTSSTVGICPWQSPRSTPSSNKG